MKHPALPETMTVEGLADYIKTRALEKYSEEQKVYYTPEEITDLERKISDKNREVLRLSSLQKTITDAIKKGSEDFEASIPETIGTDALKKGRDNLSQQVEKGYYTVERLVYGLIYDEDETLEFFDIEGNHIPERSRKLSAKEIDQHIGMFAKSLQKQA